MAQYIKQIKVGTLPYDIEALHLLDNVGTGHTYEDIVALINQGLKIVVDTKHATKEEPATTASASTMGKLYLVQLSGQLSGSYTEFITLEEGTTTKTYKWEKIGTTDVDLSNYVKYGYSGTTAEGGAGNTGSAGAATVTSSSAGAQTATGTATVTYKKADAATGSAGAGEAANTGNAGAATINGSNFTFSGTKATINGSVSGALIADHSYTPAGTISKPEITVNSTAKTVAIEGIKAVASTFTGTSATISISGNVSGTAVGDHSYAPAGSISGTQVISDHSHTATQTLGDANKESVVKSLTVGGGVLSGSQGVDTFTPNVPTAIDTTKFSGGSLTGDKTFVTSISGFSGGSLTGDTSFMKNATVSGGILSFNEGTVGYTAASLGTQNKGTVGYTAASLGTGFYTAGSAASFVQGSNTYAVSPATISTITYATVVKSLPAISIGNAGGVTVDFSKASFAGITATLEHSVTQGSFSGSTVYTPVGSIGNTYTQAGTISINNVSGAALASAPVFTGTSATIEHSIISQGGVSFEYTPEGSIGGSQTISAHSHSYTKPVAHTHGIGLTDTTITGTASVAVSDHSHSVTIANHTHTVGNHTHGFGINKAS